MKCFYWLWVIVSRNKILYAHFRRRGIYVYITTTEPKGTRNLTSRDFLDLLPAQSLHLVHECHRMIESRTSISPSPSRFVPSFLLLLKLNFPITPNFRKTHLCFRNFGDCRIRQSQIRRTDRQRRGHCPSGRIGDFIDVFGREDVGERSSGARLD
jgi:hypothetical protein